jgi:hypothetical protein
VAEGLLPCSQQTATGPSPDPGASSPHLPTIRGCIQKFLDWVNNKLTIIINTRWEATQRVMAAKFTKLIHKTAIQLHLVAESCNVCSSHSRRPVQKLLDTPSYFPKIHSDIKETGWVVVDWIHLARDRDQWRVTHTSAFNMTPILWVLCKKRIKSTHEVYLRHLRKYFTNFD